MLQRSPTLVACRFVQPEWIAAHGGWAATALHSHINFHTVSNPAEETAHTSQGGLHAVHPGSTTSDADDAQDQSSSPKPLSADAVVKQTGTGQSGSGRGLMEGEEEIASVGGSPTSKFAAMWTGPALNSSLKQAIFDQPASTSAQPVNLEDSDPAQQNPTNAAHQQATLPVTATNPAHPNTPALSVTAHQVPRAQAGYVGLGSNKTVAVGANEQKPQVTKRPGNSPSGAVAAQGTAARAVWGSGADAAQGIATRDAADCGAVAAQAEAETTADRGSGDVSTAGRVQYSSGHSQQHKSPARHLEIRTVPASPELVDVEYPLYHKYQVSNHHDKPSKVSGM